MDVAIQRTTVTPTEGGSVVQLHISDAPPEGPFGAIEIQITVSLPEYEEAILLAQAQREAMLVAQEVLTHYLGALAGRIQAMTTLRPALKSE